MIHKFERLTSIGKFRQFQAAGQINFKKLTLIYGENGGGKTTLTAVLRSLTNNEPEIIQKRISTQLTSQAVARQAAQVYEHGTPNISHSFGSSGWNIAMPDIEIFDTHFVNENVYSGFEFNDDHKKQLHQFVIGAQGVAIQQSLEQNKLDKTQARQNITALEQQLVTLIGNNMTTASIPAFINLQPIANIDTIVSTARTALTSAHANGTIQTLQIPSPLGTITTGIDFNSIINDLNSSFQTLQETTLQTLFDQHRRNLATNNLKTPESWLQNGWNYILRKNENQTSITSVECPFCSQDVSNDLSIFKAYAQHFNIAFNSLVERLQAHFISLQQFNLDANLLTLGNNLLSNSTRIASWATHLPATVIAPVLNSIPDENQLRTELQDLINIVQQKIQNPSAATITTAASRFQTSIQMLNTGISSYNLSITRYNAAIAIFKGGIQTVAQAQTMLEERLRQKSRADAGVNLICTQITSEKLRLAALTNTFSTLTQQQETAAMAFFGNYKNQINYYLDTVFKTPFKIEDMEHVAAQGRAMQPKIGYKLTIEGHDISFNEGGPFCVKECLSEGDKSTIALAFFLSKIDIDPNKINKILVFDDPLSSLDTNRRIATIGIIRALLYQLKQVIVLSHNEYFLNEIGHNIGIAEKNTLEIKSNYATKESKIQECDLDTLVKNSYFIQIEALENFRISPDFSMKDIVIGWMRTVLESHLKFRFYKELRSMTGLGTFGRTITFLEGSTAQFRDQANRAYIFTKLRQINDVSWKSHHGEPQPDFSTAGINPTNMSSAELDGLIADTLDLIEIKI